MFSMGSLTLTRLLRVGENIGELLFVCINLNCSIKLTYDLALLGSRMSVTSPTPPPPLANQESSLVYGIKYTKGKTALPNICPPKKLQN